jgi:hypothetical protein
MAPSEFCHLPPPGFQAIALNGKPIGGAMRDPVPVPPVGAVTIASDANNRGRWLEFSQANLTEAELAQGQAIANDFA